MNTVPTKTNSLAHPASHKRRGTHKMLRIQPACRKRPAHLAGWLLSRRSCARVRAPARCTPSARTKHRDIYHCVSIAQSACAPHRIHCVALCGRAHEAPNHGRKAIARGEHQRRHSILRGSPRRDRSCNRAAPLAHPRGRSPRKPNDTSSQHAAGSLRAAAVRVPHTRIHRAPLMELLMLKPHRAHTRNHDLPARTCLVPKIELAAPRSHQYLDNIGVAAGRSEHQCGPQLLRAARHCPARRIPTRTSKCIVSNPQRRVPCSGCQRLLLRPPPPRPTPRACVHCRQQT